MEFEKKRIRFRMDDNHVNKKEVIYTIKGEDFIVTKFNKDGSEDLTSLKPYTQETKFNKHGPAIKAAGDKYRS
jgi:hypothetical protein